MVTVTKKELVETISRSTGVEWRTVRRLVQAMLNQMINELGNGHRLEFRGFGVFEVRERKARTAQNPKTMLPVPVPARRTVRFKASQFMKNKVTDRETRAGNDAVIEPKPRRAARRQGARLQA